MSGALIVFEGIDGTGKNTQIELLRKTMEFEYYKYPTPHNKLISDHLAKKISLDEKELFLLFLADIASEQKKIESVLKSGKNVVLDRYVLSTIAYDKIIGYDNSKSIIFAMNFLKPTKIILLDIDPKTSRERKSKQKELDRNEENIEFLNQVREKFFKLQKDSFLSTNWHKIDTNASIDEINKKILRALAPLV